ncbi:MAG: PEP-CTERM system TPR-repeat protein PrsT [Deltaproteobacteria bacterium]|nr:PEP-CTERM system TPR-repeat protein PrsT [Deltaproteobacteria bacterium]
MYKRPFILLTIILINFGCTGKSSEELYADGVKSLREGNSNGAVVLFRNALEKNQNHINARYQLARAYLSEGKYELAEKEFQKVKRLNPAQAGIQLELAKLYNGQRKPDLAISQAEEYMTSKPDSADALEIIGIAYGIKNLPQTAETFFMRALQKDPEKLSAKLELAALKVRQGKTEQARVLLGDVIKDNPRNSRANYLLADIEIALGRKDVALILFKKLGEINPADPIAPYKAGLLHFEMEHLTIAETIAGELIKKFPANSEGYRLKGMTSYRKKDYLEAISALQNANKLQPSVVGYYFLGLSLFGKGDLESALNQFRQILDRTPNFHQARLLTGMVLLQQKRFDDAISELTKLLEADDKNPQGHNLLGNAYMAKGQYEEGMKELDMAIKMEPRLIDAYLKKGIFHFSQGKTAEVEVDLKTAIRIAPEILNTRLILSSFYEHQNDRAKALATLNEGLSGKKCDAVLYYAMARIMFADKKPNEAIHYLKKAKEFNPGAVAPHVILAGYYTGISDTGRALNEYQEVLQIEPGNVKAMLQMAALLNSSKRDKEALAWYMRAKEIRDPLAYLEFAHYYEKKGNTEKALLILDEAGRYIPRSADIMEQKVRLYLKAGQYKEALKTCDDIEPISPELAISRRVSVYTTMKKMPEAIKEAGRAIALKPDSSDGYKLLASVYQGQNNTGLAIETLKKGILRDGNNPKTALALAALYAKSGNHSLSLKTCDDILRKQPNYAPAFFTQGTVLEAKGDKKEAINKYRKALAQSSNYAAPLNNLAYLYLDGYGTKEEALHLAERAIALEPGNPVIMDTFGFALLKNNRHQEAREYLEKALALLPGDPTIRYHISLLNHHSVDKKQAVEQLRILPRAERFAGRSQDKKILAGLN